MRSYAFIGFIGFIGLALAGCPATSEDVRPNPTQFFFPTGMVMAPDESALFVVNSNAELRFSTGAVSIVDLDSVDALVDGWLATGQPPADAGADCEPDLGRPDLLQCNERQVIRADGTTRIGNFATEIAVQELASGDLRLFVPVRGDPSVTWIDFNAATGLLDCGDDESFQLCDDDRRLLSYRNDPELPSLADEPFGVFVDSGNEYAMVTHLSSGAVTVIDTPADGRPPVLSDVIVGLFAPNPETGIRGAVGVAGRQPGTPGDLVYVTSRSEARVQMLYATRAEGGLPLVVPSEFFFIDGVRPSDDSRGIVFDRDGDRAFLINRDPPMLLVFDTSSTATGFPRNELLHATELCAGASNLAVADAGRGSHAYVTCFPAGQVWVIDEIGTVEAIVDVGRGPHAVAVSEARQRMYVTNTLEDTIAVVDLTPGTATENRFVLRLGRPRQAGGE